MRKLMTAALTGLCLMLPLAAQAQDVPSYAVQQYTADQNIHGRVTSFDGGYRLSVRDERGFVDNIALHPGTIINPTGLTLAPGMVVSVVGYNAGNYFSANQIDTPYQFSGAIPYYAGRPWNYYGPSIGLSFYFGNAGWWHRSYFGGYRYVGGVRFYNRERVTEIYRHPVGGYYGRPFPVQHGYGGYYGHPDHSAGYGHPEHGAGYGHPEHGAGHSGHSDHHPH